MKPSLSTKIARKYWLRAGAPRPLRAKPEAELMRRWPDGKVRVSVLCATYNHAEYISDALEGFLSQETSFRFEVIVRDDASTDTTAEVLRTYAERYPRIIKLLLNPTNEYPKVKPFFDLLRHAQGDYIAVCEGDDYWTDSRKLQKQFKVLEKNPALVLSHHSVLKTKSGQVTELWGRRTGGSLISSSDDLMREQISRTSSRFFRNVSILEHPNSERLVGSDMWMMIQLAQYGAGIFQKNIRPSVYRLHDGGVWSSLSSREQLRTAASTFELFASYFEGQGLSDLSAHWNSKAQQFKRKSIA